MLHALRLPGFAWIAAIYSFDYVVELASSVALMVLVYEATGSPTAAAGMLVCKQVLPGALATGLGRLMERTTIGTGLAASYATTALSLAILSLIGFGPALFVIAIVSGTAAVAVRTLLRTAVARTSAGQARRQANAALNVLMGVMALTGPAVGALLVSQVSVSTALGILAGAAAALALTCTLLPREVARVRVGGANDHDAEAQAQAEAEAAPASPATTPTAPAVSTGRLLLLGGVVLGLFAMDEPALLAYAQDSLSAGVGGYGAILAAWGAGMVVGSLIYGRLLDLRMPAVFAGAVAANALGYAGLGLAPSLDAALIACLVGGAGNGVMWVALVTAIQESTTDARQGAAAARLEGVATATPAAGMIVGGLVAEFASPRSSLLIPAALSLAALAYWVIAERAALRPSSFPAANSDPANAVA